MEAYENIATYVYKDKEWSTEYSNIISEKNVLLVVNDSPLIEFLCTPLDIENLCLGFLFNEGLIEKPDEIISIEVCENFDTVEIALNKPLNNQNIWKRTSGCGGGYTSVEIVKASDSISENPTRADIILESKSISTLIEKLFKSQKVYKISGGVHTSAISDGSKILYHTEDIGRHNTFDKISGYLLVSNPKIAPIIILTTGRISSEMMQKSIKMGADIVISRTSPTIQSIKIAKDNGVTLIGYTRRNSFVTFCHKYRVSG